MKESEIEVGGSYLVKVSGARSSIAQRRGRVEKLLGEGWYDVSVLKDDGTSPFPDSPDRRSVHARSFVELWEPAYAKKLQAEKEFQERAAQRAAESEMRSAIAHQAHEQIRARLRAVGLTPIPPYEDSYVGFSREDVEKILRLLERP